MGADVIVIGVGNRLRGDDAAGLAVVDALEAAGCPATLIRSDGNPTALMAAWDEAGWVVVVDAMLGGAAGGIWRWEVADGLPPTGAFRTTHTMGLAEAAALAGALGRLPDRLTLVGIAGGRFALGRPMTAPVREAVATVANELVARIGEMTRA